MELMKSIMVAASGLKAQTARMRIIAENIANSSSTAKSADDQPYRRRMVTFESSFDRKLEAELVKTGKVVFDKSAFGKKFEPGHPAADKAGYVETPNVSTLVEMMDMRQAQRSYEANLNVVRAARMMAARTLDILRG